MLKLLIKRLLFIFALIIPLISFAQATFYVYKVDYVCGACNQPEALCPLKTTLEIKIPSNVLHPDKEANLQAVDRAPTVKSPSGIDAQCHPTAITRL
jgi:hypothetical protein